MVAPTSTPGAGILDAAGLDKLRVAARNNSPAALKAAATQFEALFLENVMKTMRDAAPADGLLDSESGRMMQTMLDQQYARAMASRGIGLADMLARQLGPRVPAVDPSADPINDVLDKLLNSTLNKAGNAAGNAAGPAAANVAAATPATAERHASGGRDVASRTRAFTERFTELAETASAATGIPAKFMLAQAALETGWGKREIRHADGSNSHNLFGIKAGKGWNGPVAEVMTTEYVNGVATRRVEKFRAYGSYAEAFADYANMLTNSSRYKTVVASASDAVGFAQGLQRAGYATDPQYADKLRRVIARV